MAKNTKVPTLKQRIVEALATSSPLESRSIAKRVGKNTNQTKVTLHLLKDEGKVGKSESVSTMWYLNLERKV